MKKAAGKKKSGEGDPMSRPKRKPARKKKATADFTLIRPGGGAEKGRELIGEPDGDGIDTMTEEELDAYIARNEALIERLKKAQLKAAKTPARPRKMPPGSEYYAVTWLLRMRQEKRDSGVQDERPIESMSDAELMAIIRRSEEERAAQGKIGQQGPE